MEKELTMEQKQQLVVIQEYDNVSDELIAKINKMLGAE